MQIPRAIEPLFKTPKTHNKIRGGRGGAKTRTVVSLIVEVMKQAPLCVICGREVQKSLKESSFLAFKNEIYRNNYGKYFNIIESQGVIESVAGGRAVFIGLQQHTVDSIKSYEGFHWAWIEEAQSVSKRSLDVLIPTLRQDKAFKIRIGDTELVFPLRMFIYTYNPYSWDDPIDMVLPDTRDDVQAITINWYDNPWFPESLNEERKEAKQIMNEEEYLRIWEGIPFENAEQAVMSRAAVLQAMERKVSQDGGVVLGVDVARFGSDRTVIYKREGLQVVGFKVLEKKDTQEIASVAADYAEGGRIIVDDTGVGGGVTDRLRKLGANVVPVNFGGKPMDKKKYPDIISEMWFNLSGLIPQIGLPKDMELLSELTSRYYKYTADERRKVESKDEYKKRTGRRSPDKADALILCFYQPRTMSASSNVRAVARI